ncbi:MAG: AAA family ATPase [Sphaerochaetaceae bacterium]|nr:AAA family ATPase [Sphaerochaetaceae bacterium]
MKRIFLLLMLLILGVCAFFFLQDNSTFTPYPDFSNSLEKGEIKKATVTKDSIKYNLYGEDFTRSTQNSGSIDLVERLLLSGAIVNDKTHDNTETTFNIAFDILFFGAAAFGLWKLYKYSKDTFRVVKKTGVTFNDIAGMDTLKKELTYAVDILKHSSEYEKKGIRVPKGIILEGPPGNGKTIFARALAQEANVNFIASKGADFQSALMSMGARKIKMLFNKGKRHKPCIIFIDEFDSIGERRNYSGTGIDKENNRIITTMLNEMDGFIGGKGVLVIAATNSYQSLDSALIRPGRFDLKYTIGNPDLKTRLELIEIYTRNKNLDSSIDKTGLAQAFDGLSCASIESILNEGAATCNLEGRSTVSLNDIYEGARKTGARIGKIKAGEKK